MTQEPKKPGKTKAVFLIVSLILCILGLVITGSMLVDSIKEMKVTYAEIQEQCKAAFGKCEQNSDCVFIEGPCGHPQGAHYKYKEQAEKRYTSVASLIECSDYPAHNFRHELACIDQHCTVTIHAK